MIGYLKKEIYYAIQLLQDNKKEVAQFIEDHKLKNFRIVEPDESTKDVFRYEINNLTGTSGWRNVTKGNYLVTQQMSKIANIEDNMDNHFIEVTLEYDINGKKC